LFHRYADGVVTFDPVSGQTISLSDDAFEFVRQVIAMIDAGGADRDRGDLLQRLLDQSRSDPSLGDIPDPVLARNLDRWVSLALHLRR
jgi:hypothetical protein